MKTVAVITSTRAEFGLLMPVIRTLRSYEGTDLTMELIVTGTHLSREFGYTIDEIKKTDLRIDKEIPIPLGSSDPLDISKNQAAALERFTILFSQKKYAGIVILGDRYEMLAIAIAAGNTRTPIFHLCGGDTTEGAMDEWIRHSITKMSYLHFPINEESYRRILQLGEAPERVFNYGSTSMDNIKKMAGMSKKDVLKSIGLADCRYAVCTYHPVTMEEGDIETQIGNFLSALEEFPAIEFIVTKSNADEGGAQINRMLDEAEKSMQNIHVYSSLGAFRYLSLVRHGELVLGNSSSGIIEAPALGVPTVNIGERQRGRLQAESILNCRPDTQSIIAAVKKAMDKEFKESCRNVASPYGNGHAAERIAKKIVETVCGEKIDLKKKFYDLKQYEGKQDEYFSDRLRVDGETANPLTSGNVSGF